MAELPQGMLAKLAPYLMGAGAGLLSNRGQLSGLGPGLLQGGELAQQQLLNRLRIQQEERAKIEQAQKDEQLARQQKIAQGFVGTPQENAAAAYPELAAKSLFPEAASSSSTSAIMNSNEFKRLMAEGDVDGANRLMTLAIPPQVRDFGNYQGLVDRATGQTSNVGTMGLPPQDQPQNVYNKASATVAGTEGAKRDFNMAGIGDVLDEAKRVLSGKVKPTGSGAGALVDRGAEFVGVTLPGQTQAADLKSLGAALVAKMPRMEGPQGVLDLKLYQEAAGMIGDDTKPTPQRLSALAVVDRLWRKYDKSNPSVSPAATPDQPKPNQVIEWDEP